VRGSTPAPRPVCVLGVGRSGTSLAARALGDLGVELGSEDDMLPPSELNPGGFWELREVLELNEEILAALGGTWWQAPPRPAGWERRPELEPFVARIADLVARHFGGAARWGFKDPRTTLTLPLWRRAVGEFDHVICLRNPLETVASAGNGLPPGADPVAIWTTYTCEALRLTEGRRRTFVFYEDWSIDPVAVARGLARFLGIADDSEAAPPGAAFDADLHREHAGELELAARGDIPFAARALHFLVRDLARAEASGEADRAAALQRLATSLESSAPVPVR
jgi:hypothetical protein